MKNYCKHCGKEIVKDREMTRLFSRLVWWKHRSSQETKCETKGAAPR